MKLLRHFIIPVFCITAFLVTGNGAKVFAQGSQIAENNGTVGTKPKTATVTPSATKVATDSPARLDVSRVGVQTAQPLPLSLNDAIRKALEGNNDIEISRDDVRFQETQLRSLLGIYDPVFRAQPIFTRNSTTGDASTKD